MQRSIYGAKDIPLTVNLDQATAETLDQLRQRLAGPGRPAVSHAEVVRVAIRAMGLQHGIRTRSVPVHPHITQEAV